jgi:hypothetical protein
VLRQAATLLLFAIEPPDDDMHLIVGIEKANATERLPATVSQRATRSPIAAEAGLANRKDPRRAQVDDTAVACEVPH